MNILFLDSINKTTYGGMEEWIRLTAQGLAGKGHRITIAGRPGSEFLRRAGLTVDSINLLELEISGDFHPGTISCLKKYISQNSIEIVTVNFNKDIRLGGLAARLDGAARVIWSVGLDITKDSLVHKVLTPRLIDGVIVPSESLKKQITRLGYINPEICNVIPIGIGDTEYTVSSENKQALRSKYNIPENAIVAVTSGRFVDQKGHKYLVEAAPAILANHPDLYFLWLGNGPLECFLKEEIGGRKIKKHFIFAGMLDNVEMELAGADLMIHPSVEEPYGIAVLEGMRAGLPVAASRVGGIPEVVSENETALLFEPRNTDDLADKVVSLLDNPDMISSLGIAGRRRWEKHFDLSTMIDRVEGCFKSVLNAEQDHACF